MLSSPMLMEVFEYSGGARAEASNVLGWLTVSTSLIVYSPQIYENYRRSSGEGVSIGLVLIWLLADLCSLMGSTLAGVAPTVILLAFYYGICDLILLVQIYYYRIFYSAHLQLLQRTPLLSRASPSNDLVSHAGTTPSDMEKPQHASTRQLLINYSLLWAFVGTFGIIAFLFNHSTNQSGAPSDGRNNPTLEWKSQILGWVSTSFYVGARLPQLKKNGTTRCEGLSLGLFMFTIAGNFFYALSLLVLPMDWNGLIVTASWLAGSLLCIILDSFVLGQWFHFRRQDMLELERQKTPT
ncbi:hypothetical protein DL93DRAFT_2167969 [Clavulina sp. PMI_390]|nr:hypothetical protein DL93DRAFT_2167969 [Clavulina sp. PMI_390]